MTDNKPIIIVGPTQRCGTTLLQRLFNSTRKAIVFGENFYFLQRLPESLLGLHQNAKGKAESIKKTQALYLETSFDFEGSALFPDYLKYLAATRAGFEVLVRFYGDQAKEMGLARWGIKHQIRDHRGFAFLLRLLPQAHYIYIYRDLVDVARSAKARWPQDYQDPAAFDRLGAVWQANMQLILAQKESDNALVIKYEDFIADPEPTLDRLETMTGVSGIDRSVMGRRVNTYPKIDQTDPTKAENVYQKPSGLEAPELAALLGERQDFYQGLGYQERTG